jgi:hypothetical protein
VFKLFEPAIIPKRKRAIYENERFNPITSSGLNSLHTGISATNRPEDGRKETMGL